jgi:hypothetical protein
MPVDDFGQDVGEIGERIDVVELASLDRDAPTAQCSAPPSDPENSAFLRLSLIPRIDRSTVLLSSSLRSMALRTNYSTTREFATLILASKLFKFKTGDTDHRHRPIQIAARDIARRLRASLSYDCRELHECGWLASQELHMGRGRLGRRRLSLGQHGRGKSILFRAVGRGIRARFGMDPIIRYFETSAITDNKPVEPTIRRFNARRVGAVAES